MSRTYVPDPAGLAAALAGRVDALETEARTTRTDLTAIGRGLAALTAQIRTYTATTTLIGDDETDSEANEAPESEPQPDWLTVDDPTTAEAWLLGLGSWLENVGTHHGLTPIEPCWPLHPDVVALLLALQTERDAAYDGQRPTPVTEWLTRWLPATQTGLAAALAPCAAEAAHRHGTQLHTVRGLDLSAVAAWWTLRRDTPAPVALRLPTL